MKTFLNDKDGFSKEDFEKLVLGFLFVVVTLVITYKFATDSMIDSNIVFLDTGLGSLFVVRKAVSYFKPQNYYDYNNYNSQPQPLPVNPPELQENVTMPNSNY